MQAKLYTKSSYLADAGYIQPAVPVNQPHKETKTELETMNQIYKCTDFKIFSGKKEMKYGEKTHWDQK